MKKLILTSILVSGLILSGCGAVNKVQANVTGSSQSCIEGVKYVQMSRGASVMYNQDGSVKNC